MTTTTQAIARLVKRTPGYRFALTTVLPRVRRHALLSDLAWRVWGARHGAGQEDVPLHGGHHLQGPDVRMLPVVGFLATSQHGTEDDLHRLVNQVSQLQRAHVSFRPLFIVDRPIFELARQLGYVVELVTPERDFADPAMSGEGRVTWTDYLARRVAGIIDHYQLWHLVKVDGYRLDTFDEAMLARVAERLPELRVWVR